jgi:hypothetical protein
MSCICPAWSRAVTSVFQRETYVHCCVFGFTFLSLLCCILVHLSCQSEKITRPGYAHLSSPRNPTCRWTPNCSRIPARNTDSLGTASTHAVPGIQQRVHAVVIIRVVKGPAADASDALQSWGLLCNPMMKMMIIFCPFPSNGAQVEWNWQGKTEELGEEPVHHKSHMDWPGIEPGPPRWEASG